MLVCSDQGFSMTHDADGFYTPHCTQMQCMAIIGVWGGTPRGVFLL